MQLKVRELAGDLERYIDTYQCECGGTATRVPSTPEEIKRLGCGRSFECCNIAFVCNGCNTRIISSLEAPEWNLDQDWDEDDE